MYPNKRPNQGKTIDFSTPTSPLSPTPLDLDSQKATANAKIAELERQLREKTNKLKQTQTNSREEH